MSSSPGDVTVILLDLRRGDREAQDRLIPLIYEELRRIARAHLRREVAHHSLQPTALVHEAYFRLIAIDRVDWQGRAHFFAVASNLMRRILVEHARSKDADKRGGGAPTIVLEEARLPSPARSSDVIAVDDALDRLEELDPRQARTVEMRFFAGMTEEEIADVLGISVRTVKRDWRIAKAWLYKELGH